MFFGSRTLFRLSALFFLPWTAFAPISGASAQDATVVPVPVPATATVLVVPKIPEEHRSAQAAMRTFLEAMGEVQKTKDETRLPDAVDCLDLSEIPRGVREDTGRDRAVMLKEVIDRVRYVNWWSIPDATEGEEYVFHEHEVGSIVIDRDEVGHWRFTKETISTLPDLFREYESERKVAGGTEEIGFVSLSLWLRGKFPDSLRQSGFLLEHWQWVCLFCVIAIGIIGQRLFAFVVNHKVAARFKRRKGWNILNPRDTDLGKPLGVMLMSLFWIVCLRFLALPPQSYEILLIALKVMGTLGLATAATRAVNFSTDLWLERAKATEGKLDDLLVPLTRGILKSLVILVAVLFLATVLDFNPTSLLAGVGLGGLAFALAAQDIISNLFGSFTLLLDRPFQIGDWVVIDNVEGTVEAVGFRTTRVRTFYDSVITIPNSKLTNTPLDNYGARKYRRFKTVLSLTYNTPPEKIEAFCEGVRRLVELSPHTRKDYFHVYLNAFSASSLDVLLYIFFRTPDWAKELEARHDMMLSILRLAKSLGVEFAFPTRTLFMNPEPGEDPIGQPMTGGSAQAREIGSRAAEEVMGRSDDKGSADK